MTLNLLQEIRRRTQAVAYGSPIYRMMLEQGPVPDRLRLIVTDPWPGDAQAGQAMMAAPSGLFEAETFRHLDKNRALLAHGWLRDLRAVGTESARRKALTLMEDWLDYQDVWQEEGWAPDVLGERLANWVSFYDFYNAAPSSDFTPRLIASMVRQLRHLLRVLPADLAGVANLQAIKGLIYAGLGLLDSERALGLGLELLHRQLENEILPDGGHSARDPSQHLQTLRALIAIRAALRAAQMEVPHALTTAVERMVPALKLYRHGDGGLALFNGGHEGSVLEMDAALTLAEARGRVLRRLPQTGYERVTAGRSLLLIDVGAPPPRPYDSTAHAGLLAFEFSVGRERLIVNCGAGPTEDSAWRLATASTAAHSTLTLNDTNAAEILVEGGIGHRPKHVTSQRYEQNGVAYVEAAHDGYVGRARVTHHRTLSLAAEGDELRGREVLSGALGADFTLRWHLHPSVQAALVQGGQAVLLLLPSGAGWRLRVDSGEGFNTGLALEPSIYCGGTAPRRTLQIKISGRMAEDPTIVKWALGREKKG